MPEAPAGVAPGAAACAAGRRERLRAALRLGEIHCVVMSAARAVKFVKWGRGRRLMAPPPSRMRSREVALTEGTLRGPAFMPCCRPAAVTLLT